MQKQFKRDRKKWSFFIWQDLSESAEKALSLEFHTCPADER